MIRTWRSRARKERRREKLKIGKEEERRKYTEIIQICSK
jgi:hypothetical protein